MRQTTALMIMKRGLPPQRTVSKPQDPMVRRVETSVNIQYSNLVARPLKVAYFDIAAM
jgi:hypothetical protein